MTDLADTQIHVLERTGVSNAGEVKSAEVAAEIAALDASWSSDWHAPDEHERAPQVLGSVPEPTAAARFVIRTIDIVVALIALIAVLPIMAIVAIAVRRTSPGGAIFRHTRVGRDGESFEVYKFRSMAVGTHGAVLDDESALQAYADNDFKLTADDPRITPVGRFIRTTSLDELPQFVNVLRGEMSIVGIRPLEAAQLETRTLHDQQLYRSMRPGLTGLWQVSGRSSLGRDDRIELDRSYVEDWSVGRDLSIMVRTPVALLRASDAY